MVFCVNLGFSNLSNSAAKDEQGKVYALFIGDVVLVNEVREREGERERVCTTVLTTCCKHCMIENPGTYYECYFFQSGPATELSSASKKKLRSVAIFFGVS